jgi:hypothetical protein
MKIRQANNQRFINYFSKIVLHLKNNLIFADRHEKLDATTNTTHKRQIC